jgi:hypothetical protein
MTAPTSVDAIKVDPLISVTDATAIMTRRFPGMVIWFGGHTRHWWAMVHVQGRWRLVEASGHEELTSAIVDTSRDQWPPARATAGRLWP